MKDLTKNEEILLLSNRQKSAKKALKNTPHSPRLPSGALAEHYELEVAVGLQR
jgi:hypothetical protein